MVRSRDKREAVVCYMGGKIKRRNVSQRRTASTSACGRTTACTEEWLRSSGGRPPPELLVVTRKRGVFVIREFFCGGFMTICSTEENGRYEKAGSAERGLPQAKKT